MYSTHTWILNTTAVVTVEYSCISIHSRSMSSYRDITS